MASRGFSFNICVCSISISLPETDVWVVLIPGDAVVNVYINQEKKFAFVEMRTVEEASNAMALDGIIFEVILSRPMTMNLFLLCFETDMWALT